MRWAIVAAALLVMAAAWPLHMYSRHELAPVEDQCHISLFLEASPDSSLVASNRASLSVVDAVASFPEAKFMWSLTSAWGGFGGIVAKDWRERTRSTEEMYGEVYASLSQVPGLRVFSRLDPPLPIPGQYDVELVLQSEAPPEQMLETTTAVLGAGWQSGKFLYVEDAGRPARAGVDLHAHRDQHRAAGAEPLPAAQRGAHFRRRQAGVTKEEGLRVLETAAAGAQGVVLDHAGEPRQIRREGSALATTLGFAVVLIYPGFLTGGMEEGRTSWYNMF